MEQKVYRTIDEINRDLKIYKVEKDLAYQRLLKDIDDTKESLEFKNLIGNTPKKILNVLGLVGGPLKSAALTWIFKKIF